METYYYGTNDKASFKALLAFLIENRIPFTSNSDTYFASNYHLYVYATNSGIIGNIGQFIDDSALSFQTIRDESRYDDDTLADTAKRVLAEPFANPVETKDLLKVFSAEDDTNPIYYEYTGRLNAVKEELKDAARESQQRVADATEERKQKIKALEDLKNEKDEKDRIKEQVKAIRTLLEAIA